jgi:protein-disulfide isomerase
MAAQAAEAAAKQGRFWEMHDLLFENQSDLSEDALIALAGRIGLDEEQFVEDLDSAAMAEKVRLSVNDGQEKGITATSTFFINGEKVEDSRNYAQVLELLKSKLAA